MYCIPKEGYLIQAKISLAQELGAEDGSGWIEMREPSTQDFVKLQAAIASGDMAEQVKQFSALLPSLIVDHDFFAEADDQSRKKLTTPELVDEIGKRSDLFLAVIRKYTEDVLFIRGKKLGAR